MAGRHLFLGDDRDAGRERTQAGDDDEFRGVVGVGDGAPVGLVAHTEIAGVDPHDFGGGGFCELGAGLAEMSERRKGRGHGTGCVGGGDLITHSVMVNRLLGVLSALPEELAHLSDRSADSTVIGGLPFWRGQIAGREAVFVESGAGKVNAGIATTLLLDRFDCRALLLCGVAGGLDPAMGVGDIVVGTSNVQHDYGLEKEDGFVHIQPGSRPSLGQDWAPGYPVPDPLIGRLQAAVSGLVLDPLPETVDEFKEQLAKAQDGGHQQSLDQHPP